MKFKKIGLRHILRVVPFLLIIAIVLTLVFYPHRKSEAASKRIVEVWNVDTFEGGKGSRTSFLSAAARRLQQKNADVYYFVASYTIEGARAALAEGQMPDVLSFGVGLSDFEAYAQPLNKSFAGDNRAIPWCGGKYLLFSLTNDFSDGGGIAISCGGSNLPTVSAALAGLTGEEVPSTEAYVDFLAGKYRYLLGTQRDVCRFAARGVAVYTKELPAYCDLYQYISILSAEKRKDAEGFLDELLSPKSQEQLVNLGMYPAGARGAELTASVFSANETLLQLSDAARTGDRNFLYKLLKTI